MKIHLPRVTLFGLDCVGFDRLALAAEICQNDFEYGDVKLLTSVDTNHPDAVKIPSVSSIEQYSDFMIEAVNQYIETDFALVIQHDGFILNPAAWTDEFLNWDYIGAPWWENGSYLVGNGGFSLRSKKLLELLEKREYKNRDNNPEDWFLSVTIRKELEAQGIQFAPMEIARKFSFEANDRDGVTWTGQLGFHGLTWTDISAWLKQHPQYHIKNELDSWAKETKQRLGR